MPGAETIFVEGRVMEALPNRTYRVQLANGHCLLAFVAGKQRAASVTFAPGETVRLALSPFDLSEGRIILENQKS